MKTTLYPILALAVVAAAVLADYAWDNRKQEGYNACLNDAKDKATAKQAAIDQRSLEQAQQEELAAFQLVNDEQVAQEKADAIQTNDHQTPAIRSAQAEVDQLQRDHDSAGADTGRLIILDLDSFIRVYNDAGAVRGNTRGAGISARDIQARYRTAGYTAEDHRQTRPRYLDWRRREQSGETLPSVVRPVHESPQHAVAHL